MNVRQRTRRVPEPEPAPAEPEPVLVTDEELEAIRWGGYESAIGDAIAHRDRSVNSAADRLDKAMRGAYLEYGRSLEAAEATFTAAHRAAMRAHELAQGRAS